MESVMHYLQRLSQVRFQEPKVDRSILSNVANSSQTNTNTIFVFLITTNR